MTAHSTSDSGVAATLQSKHLIEIFVLVITGTATTKTYRVLIDLPLACQHNAICLRRLNLPEERCIAQIIAEVPTFDGGICFDVLLDVRWNGSPCLGVYDVGVRSRGAAVGGCRYDSSSATPSSPTVSTSSSSSSALPSVNSTPTTPVRPTTPTRTKTGPVYEYQSPSRPVTLTPRWAEALHQTQGVSGAHARKIVKSPASPRRHCVAWVVFRGSTTGVFLKSLAQWPTVQAAVAGFTGAVQQGYESVSSANAAWSYYHALGYTSTTPQDGLALALESMPKPLPMDFSLVPPQRLQGRAPEDFWYVVVHGVQPGVYPTYLEMSLHTSGVSVNGYHKTGTFEEAVAHFRTAQANHETEVQSTPTGRARGGRR
ncbi:hypothetical protein C8F01DRAFT_1276111 [Mycena amicta]|nr:hypothetical protein C8F01DRAFT_1276111 [Mycena amicta]